MSNPEPNTNDPSVYSLFITDCAISVRSSVICKIIKIGVSKHNKDI